MKLLRGQASLSRQATNERTQPPLSKHQNLFEHGREEPREAGNKQGSGAVVVAAAARAPHSSPPLPSPPKGGGGRRKKKATAACGDGARLTGSPEAAGTDGRRVGRSPFHPEGEERDRRGEQGGRGGAGGGGGGRRQAAVMEGGGGGATHGRRSGGGGTREADRDDG